MPQLDTAGLDLTQETPPSRTHTETSAKLAALRTHGYRCKEPVVRSQDDALMRIEPEKARRKPSLTVFISLQTVTTAEFSKLESVSWD